MFKASKLYEDMFVKDVPEGFKIYHVEPCGSYFRCTIYPDKKEYQPHEVRYLYYDSRMNLIGEVYY